MSSRSRARPVPVASAPPQANSRASRRRRFAALLSRTVFSLSIAALASPAQATLSCSVQTDPVVFGVYQATTATAATGRGDVVVSCTCTLLDCIATGYTVSVGAGGSGDASARKMSRTGGGTLNYQLYADALGLTPWTSPQGQLYLLTLFGASQTVFVYGRIPPNQLVPSGAYADAPSVLISY
jgi:spore coat protein U domain-containing protein, fimbrial subunit CupE1/2/3/6